MKAITLWQPWASLVTLGVKPIETRSWAPPASAIGQPLAIHAAAANVRTEPVGDWLAYRNAAGEWEMQHHARGCIGAPDDVPLPLGAVVATCTLTDVVPIGETCDDGDPFPRVFVAPKRPPHLLSFVPYPELVFFPDPMEEGEDITDQRPYGDFTPGRYAWLFDDIKPTTERCPGCWGTGDEELFEIFCYLCGAGFDDPVRNCLDCGCSMIKTGRCPTCDGSGTCEPVPAKGHQRLWEWSAA